MCIHIFGPNFQEKVVRFNFLIQFIYLFIFRNKTDYHIPRYYFAYRYHYCFLELHFYRISISKTIKNIYTDTELELPMYNAHPYFSLKNLAKKVHIICSEIW